MNSFLQMDSLWTQVKRLNHSVSEAEQSFSWWKNFSVKLVAYTIGNVLLQQNWQVCFITAFFISIIIEKCIRLILQVFL